MSKKKKKKPEPPSVVFIACEGGIPVCVFETSDSAGMSGYPYEAYVSLTRVRELFAEKGIETNLRLVEDE